MPRAGRPGWAIAAPLLVLSAPCCGAEELRPLARFYRARSILGHAFGQPRIIEGLIPEAYQDLWHVMAHIREVTRGRCASVLFSGAQSSECDHLSSEDSELVYGFFGGHVFTLHDVLMLLMMPEEERRSALEKEDRLTGLRKITDFLRAPWWEAFQGELSMWATSFFGSLALIARMFASNASRSCEDVFPLSDAAGGAATLTHFIGAPASPFEYSRSVAYRHASAWLRLASSRSMVEEAERHFKAFEQTSLLAVLRDAAEWPVFDCFHRLALRAASLADDEDDQEPASEEGEAPSEADAAAAVVVQAGEQTLSEEDVLDLYQMLHIVGRLCDALGIEWWVSHGTLIGALRDGGLSRHADDCEIDISEEHVEAFQGVQMRRSLGRNGYELSFDPRGQVFKVWPAGSKSARIDGGQLADPTWWLPQRRVGTPSLDIYIVHQDLQGGGGHRQYLSNAVFHLHGMRRYTWFSEELDSFERVPFGSTQVRVPRGSVAYLDRVYGADWNDLVRPHGWDSETTDFEPLGVLEIPERPTRHAIVG
eukprot:TRINITY_DN36587_c0_g1_i2.p1 TRINITY_DN36587_c0_g1~~TRINITY_DN36587_c0_g1_i2.p1  ORF type:complete len:537 (+),score=111.32 TRINITY_DN36587_c0_g1_i2:125-1735(+)